MSDYEHLIPGAHAHRPRDSEPSESDFLRSPAQMDPYEGDGDEFMTARSQSFDEPLAGMGSYRTEAMQAGGNDGFDIAQFRRMQGLPPPPQAAPLIQPRPPRVPAAAIEESSSDDDFSMDDDTASLSTRSFSTGNPYAALLERNPLNGPVPEAGNAGDRPAPPSIPGPPRPKKRGFFKKLWSAIRGRGWR